VSLRDLFQDRQLPRETVALPTDPAGWADAERRVEAAVRVLQAAASRMVPDLGPYQAAVDEAQAALAAQPTFEVELKCLPPTVWDELVEEHPPTDEQRRQGWQWNVPTFRPALLAACVVVAEGERGMSEAEWAALADAGRATYGELDLLFATAVNVNARQPQVSTGKGLSGTRP